VGAPLAHRTRLSRRAFLSGALLALGGGALASARVLAPVGSGDWDDPLTWSAGTVPGPDTVAVVDRRVLLSRSAQVGGVRITKAGSLVLQADREITLTSTGSVVVDGSLMMRPEGGRHELLFSGILESAFRGGTDGTPDTDIGLWVQGTGVLDARGGARRAWSRLSSPVEAGAVAIELADDPQQWRPGDELVLVPTGGGHGAGGGYDSAKIRAVDGRRVQLDRPLSWAHAATLVPGADVLGGEVLNLTRDVVIRGTATGRAHVLVQSAGRQVLKGVRLDHLGPSAQVGAEAAAAGAAVPVVGRYGLHLHHCGDAARGSSVEQVVVTRCGNHAFVAHESPGVTFRDCIAHDTVLSQYWWDAQGVTDKTDDVTYTHCVASLARSAPGIAPGTPHLSRRIAGFDLLRGRGNRALHCVAVGNTAGLESAGFAWQEDAEGVWETRGCSSHDNSQHGSFVWQNTHEPHVIDSMSVFHNGGFGFVHGAYSNSYSYVRCASYANGLGAVLRQANGAQSGPAQEWRDCVLDAAGRSAHVVLSGPHEFPPTSPVVFRRCRLRGAGVSALGQYQAADLRSWTAVDLVDCDIDGVDVRATATYEASRWRIQRANTAFELVPVPGHLGPRGTLVERPIQPFAT
jgi:hypothetical protein